MTIQQRWNQTALHNKCLAIAGIVAALAAVAAAMATIDYAHQARLQVDIMRQNGATELRPWLTVQTFSLPAPLDQMMKLGNVPAVRVSVTNSGRTPALRVKIAGAVFVRKAHEYRSTTAGPVTESPTSVAVLGPNSPPYFATLDCSEPVRTQLQIDGIMSGTTRLYVGGEIYYEDIFRASHITRFCVFLEGPGLPPEFTSCPEDNSVE